MAPIEQAGKLALRLDGPETAPAAELALSASAEWQTETFALPEKLTGCHDLCLCFDTAGVELDSWQFARAE